MSLFKQKTTYEYFVAKCSSPYDRMNGTVTQWKKIGYFTYLKHKLKRRLVKKEIQYTN